MEGRVIKTRIGNDKFEVTINNFPVLKETTVTVTKETMSRALDGKFWGYRYQGTIRKVVKSVNIETRERNISKYLAKFGIEL